MLLFPAIIETFLYRIGEEWDPMRVDYAIRQHEQWYKGDGIYGGGPFFHWDYYNSFVIQPMILDIFYTVSDYTQKMERLSANCFKKIAKICSYSGKTHRTGWLFPSKWSFIVLS